MQMGTRWTSGDEPPRAVPDTLRAEIDAVDRSIPGDDLGQPRPRWTLTWLEGRPVAELDTGVQVALQADGSVRVSHDADDVFP